MQRVLAIGLDSGELGLLEKWMADGTLPNLKRLRDVGAYGPLKSTSDLLSGSTWVTFQTGMSPENHGMYNYLAWRPDRMTAEVPSTTWVDLPIFWRSFDNDGPRAIVMDVPLALETQPFNGIEVVGWSTHDSLIPLNTYPPEFAKRLAAQYGSSLQRDEKYGPMTKNEFRAIRDDSIWITKTLQEVCISLEKEQEWDLFLTIFTAIHRASHKIFDAVNVSEELTTEEQAEFDDALRQVYIACDAAVGEMVEAAGPDTTVLVFSLTGIEENSSRSIVLQDLIDMIVEKHTQRKGISKGFLQQIRSWIPLNFRHWVKSNLPLPIRHRLTAFWRHGQTDWSKTPVINLISDVQGWVRVNLKGRESQGIVEPGEEFEKWCEIIENGVKSFVDADTGQPIVKETLRSSEVLIGKRTDWLPDVIILWEDSNAAQHRALYSPEYGTFQWPTPGMHPEGRSGGHTGTGFLLVAGNRIKSGNIKDAHILDLAPTILSLLEHPIHDHMEGRVLQILKTN